MRRHVSGRLRSTDGLPGRTNRKHNESVTDVSCFSPRRPRKTSSVGSSVLTVYFFLRFSRLFFFCFSSSLSLRGKTQLSENPPTSQSGNRQCSNWTSAVWRGFPGRSSLCWRRTRCIGGWPCRWSTETSRLACRPSRTPPGPKSRCLWSWRQNSRKVIPIRFIDDIVEINIFGTHIAIIFWKPELGLEQRQLANR